MYINLYVLDNGNIHNFDLSSSKRIQNLTCINLDNGKIVPVFN
jgi:hypothetical protein